LIDWREPNGRARQPKDEFALLDARCFPPNNIVALDDRCHSAQITGIILLAIDAHYPAMGPHKNFCSASDLRGQSQSEIDFSPSRKLFFHDEIHAARGNIAGMSALCPWFPVEWCTNIHRKGQIVPSSRTTLCYPHWSSPEDSEAHPHPVSTREQSRYQRAVWFLTADAIAILFVLRQKKRPARGLGGYRTRKKPCKTRGQTLASISSKRLVTPVCTEPFGGKTSSARIVSQVEKKEEGLFCSDVS